MDKLFCDLDGVLADFDEGVKSVTGRYPNELELKDMWRSLARSNDFYANLNFMPDGKELWNYIKKYDPIILTGLPMGNWAKPQKMKWVGENLGWDVQVIACMARDKHNWSDKGHILIDDRIKAKQPWVNKGGTFIHHISTKDTIDDLKVMGL